MIFDSTRIRRTILDMALAGSSVHIACAFSIVELLAVLYRSHLADGGSPTGAQGHLILSKGHGVMAQYACLLEAGKIAADEVGNYFHDGTRLKGLAEAGIPGVGVTSGSLGHGLPVAVGLALAARRQASDRRIYVVVGDGEMNEGSVWEALLFAVHNKLGNLCVIVDENGYQAMGRTADIMSLGGLAGKLSSFGLAALEVDGHDEAAIESVLVKLDTAGADTVKGMVAHTVKGKGVSFMEGRNEWHYTRLNADTYAAACAELEASV